jgi:amino acid permease
MTSTGGKTPTIDRSMFRFANCIYLISHVYTRRMRKWMIITSSTHRVVVLRQVRSFCEKKFILASCDVIIVSVYRPVSVI